jgi:hypothetical protein
LVCLTKEQARSLTGLNDLPKVICGYSAKIDPETLGHNLSAFVAITPLDPSQPDDAPARLRYLPAVDSCRPDWE